MEAMAAGTPVVATDIGGTNELIRSGETGLLVPVASPMALAESVRSLLNDPARAHALAAAAQAQAQRDFGFDRVVRRVAEIYDELLVHNS